MDRVFKYLRNLLFSFFGFLQISVLFKLSIPQCGCYFKYREAILDRIYYQGCLSMQPDTIIPFFFFFNISLEWTHKLKLWINYIYFNLNMLLSDPYLFSLTWLLSHIWTCFFFVFIESNWYSEWQPARGRKVGARCSLRSIQSILWFNKSPYRLQTPGPI